MILAFDTYYFGDKAKTVCLGFKQWNDAKPVIVDEQIISNVVEYVPGEFYKRELPCILGLLGTMDLSALEAIVVDGFVVLDDDGKPGLGGYLFEHLGKQIPIIGVAKTNFATLVINKRAVERGGSKRPLFITTMGVDLDIAAQHIRDMDGIYRIPTLLKQLDMLTKVPSLGNGAMI